MQCKTKDAYGQCSESVRMVRAMPEASKKIDLGSGRFIYLFDTVPAADGLCSYCHRKRLGLFN